MPVFKRKRSILFLIMMLGLLAGVIAISFVLVGQQAAIETRAKNTLRRSCASAGYSHCCRTPRQGSAVIS